MVLWRRRLAGGFQLSQRSAKPPAGRRRHKSKPPQTEACGYIKIMSLEVAIEKKVAGFQLAVEFATDAAPLGLLGPSGSGKSMTLRAIAGLETPDRGRIVLNGNVLFDSARKINVSARKRRIGLLFQNYALFPHLTVAENI